MFEHLNKCYDHMLFMNVELASSQPFPDFPLPVAGLQPRVHCGEDARVPLQHLEGSAPLVVLCYHCLLFMLSVLFMLFVALVLCTSCWLLIVCSSQCRWSCRCAHRSVLLAGRQTARQFLSSRQRLVQAGQKTGRTLFGEGKAKNQDPDLLHETQPSKHMMLKEY